MSWMKEYVENDCDGLMHQTKATQLNILFSEEQFLKGKMSDLNSWKKRGTHVCLESSLHPFIGHPSYKTPHLPLIRDFNHEGSAFKQKF